MEERTTKRARRARRCRAAPNCHAKHLAIWAQWLDATFHVSTCAPCRAELLRQIVRFRDALAAELACDGVKAVQSFLRESR